MDDYYEFIGVDRTASRDAIDRKIREQLRVWQRRTATADLARRQEAERRVQQLSEARTTLLDEAKRREYDRKLTAFRSSEPPPSAPTSLDARMPAEPAWDHPPDPGAAAGDPPAGGTWLEQARAYLRDNDYHSAAYAARETLRGSPNPPAAAWSVLARANLGLGRVEDALFEARRAAAADPGSADAHLTLARVHERRQDWTEAWQEYEAAEEVADARHPDAEAAHLGVMRMLARSGRTASAVDRMERRYASTPDRMAAGRLLARGMVEASRAALETVGTQRTVGTAELGQVRRMLGRVREVSTDVELLRPAAELEQQLERRARGRPPGGQGRPADDPLRRGYRSPEPGGVPYRTNTLAVVALVLAVLGLVSCGVASVPGAVLGHVARRQIRDRGEQGEGMALAAVVVGWLVTAGACCAGIMFYGSGSGL